MHETPRLVCPRCREHLAEGRSSLDCPSCAHRYPIVAGIPDLRLEGDRYLSVEEDRAKALALAEVEGGFADVVRAYWRSTPEVPAALARQYERTMLDGVRRGDAYLRELGPDGNTLLDVGCGTGGLLVAAARRGLHAVGVDVALRWLVVARRQLHEAGVDAQLVAADGAVLPFRAGNFDTATAIETLEHVADQGGLLHACMASVRPGGSVYVVTANRFSLAPDPMVGLWGVGLLPRRLSAGYVRRRRHTRFQYVRRLSVWELRAMLGPNAHMGVTPAALPPPPVEASALRRVAQSAYERVRCVPGGRGLAVVIGPYLEVRG